MSILSEEAIEQRRAAGRASVESRRKNGATRHNLGRPMLPENERIARHLARLRITRLTPRAVAFLYGVMSDKDVDLRLRIRAAENILDRGGVPRRAKIDAQGDAPTVPPAQLMVQVFERVAREMMANPEAGRVRAVDADFKLVEEEKSSAGNGEPGTTVQ